jgi:hypothetical protein
MKNKGNAVLIGFSIILVGLAGFFVIKGIMSNKNRGNDKKDPKDDLKPIGGATTGGATTDGATTGGTSSGGATATNVNNLTFPIKKGSKIEDIKAVQKLILGYDNRLLPKYKDDGKWGKETENALQKIIKKKTIDSQADLDLIIKLGVARATNFLFGVK